MAINICGLDTHFLVSLILTEPSIAAKRPLKTEGEGKKAYLHGIVQEFWRGISEIKTWQLFVGGGRLIVSL